MPRICGGAGIGRPPLQHYYTSGRNAVLHCIGAALPQAYPLNRGLVPMFLEHGLVRHLHAQTIDLLLPHLLSFATLGALLEKCASLKPLGFHAFSVAFGVHKQEPSKGELLEYESSGKVPMRQASVILTKPPTNNPIEMELDLDSGCVLSYKKVRSPVCVN